MATKPKLELTWIGKETRPRLEPRILIEDSAKSYHAAHRVGDTDLFDNKLIFGDNLLALRALEAEFTDKVKCIYIDPPFNTGAAFEHYDDGLEHSIWLGLMRHRFELMHKLLKSDGCLFVHLDDKESAYCKVVLDEVFGRANYVNTIINATNQAFGFKSTSEGLFKQANHILLYAKDKSQFHMNSDRMFIEKEYDNQYRWVFTKIDCPESEWKWENIYEVVARERGFSGKKEAKTELGEKELDLAVSLYAIQNANRVFRTASVSGGAYLKRKETIAQSKKMKEVIVRHPNDDMDYQFIGGERVLYYRERLQEIDGQLLPGQLITDIWTDIPTEGLASEGGVDFPKGKKPEKLIQRCIELTTSKGDLVLDSFAGSGTTGAVAQKTGRKWIMVELGEHCNSHILPRLRSVINGSDQSGITQSVGWKGGGGFRYYKLAPSLLEKDKWGNWVINKEYNAAMLAEALCKLEGFTYAPSETEYFIHGHSTETDFIWVTTQNLGHEQLAALSEDVGADRTLLVLCSAYRADTRQFPNLTIKKIPNAVLSKCEWGHDDYSLQVENLPAAPKPKVDQPDLFGGEG